MRRVVVIGGGVAGTAAAHALAARGVETTIVLGAPGATHLSPGTLDGDSAEETRAFVAALGGYSLDGSMVATLGGDVRPCRGLDRALLDLARVDDGLVLVPRLPRLGWDADAIAWMLSAHPLAVARKLEFRAVDTSLIKMTDERMVPDATIAARHDDSARLTWLSERLSHAHASAQAEGGKAWLLPPWLGCERERGSELSALVGVPCGEIAVGLSGPSGFRFSAARNRAIKAAGVRVMAGFVESVVESEGSVTIVVEGGDAFDADAAVIATGGLVGGGLVYEPSEAEPSGELPPEPRPYMRAALANMIVGVRGTPLDVPGSLFGVAPETLAWPFVERGDLERAGVLIDEGGRVFRKRRLFAAGELVADRPRTWLEAARAGLSAGALAAVV